METGSEEALNLLMQVHYEPIRAYITMIIGNPHDADEITNETFLKAFNKREMIKDPERLVGWLYITAKHLAIDRHRAKQQDADLMLVSLDNLDGEVEAASMLAAEQAQQTKTDHDLLKGLLRLLPKKDLEVVEHLLADLKPKQIAEAIGSTAEAVQKRWERMREWLSPIAQNLDELLNNLPPQEQKIMERYVDNQPLEKISEKIGVSPTDIEVCVKRVVKRWKKIVTQNATKQR